MRGEKTECSKINSQSLGLSRTQETELMFAYHNGLMAEEKKKQKVNSAQELDAAIMRGREAEEILLLSHFPLVKSLALQLFNKNKEYVDLEDLVSAGKEGLVIALRKFDPQKGCRFNTYAKWWVSNRVRAEIRKERWPIHIPDHIYKALTPVMKFFAYFNWTMGRNPTLYEIAKEFDQSVYFCRKLLSWLEQKEISLSTPIGDDGMSTLEDFIEDKRVMDPTDLLVNRDLRQTISQVLSTLTPREEKAIRLRFGLEVNLPKRRGRPLATNTNTAQVIEFRALRKLRHPSRSRRLRHFVRRDKDRVHET